MAKRKQQVWQGGVCKGLVVDSPEATRRLEELGLGYTASFDKPYPKMLDHVESQEDRSEEMDLFDWLMEG